MFYLALVNTIAFLYHILSEFSAFQMDVLGREGGGGGGGGGRLKGILKELCIAVVTIKLYDIWLLEEVTKVTFLFAILRLSTVSRSHRAL